MCSSIWMRRDSISPKLGDVAVISLNALHDRLMLPHERGLFRADISCFVIILDNMAFHHSWVVNNWFIAHPRKMILFLPAYSPMLNPIEEFFSCWRWKVYDHRPHDQMSLLDAMNAACLAIRAEGCQRWIRHSRRFFPWCIAMEHINCDVEENMWPNRQVPVDNVWKMNIYRVFICFYGLYS